jgi:hypothetical protein
MARNDTQNGGLDATAELLIVALLRKPTVKEAAAEVGISLRTAFRWLQKPEFQTRYTEARRAGLTDAISEMQGAALLAVETLKRNLNCGQPFAENAAAGAILTHAMKGAELQDLQAEVEEIKRMLAEREGGKGLREARA